MIAVVSTVKELIEESARNVKASPTFVEAVLELFRSKGISLESRAEPYAEMIGRAFTSHGAQRETFTRIQAELNELNTTLVSLRRSWMELADKTRQLEEMLQRRQQANKQAAAARTAAEQAKKEEKKQSFLIFPLRNKLLPN